MDFPRPVSPLHDGEDEERKFGRSRATEHLDTKDQLKGFNLAREISGNHNSTSQDDLEQSRSSRSTSLTAASVLEQRRKSSGDELNVFPTILGPLVGHRRLLSSHFSSTHDTNMADNNRSSSFAARGGSVFNSDPGRAMSAGTHDSFLGFGFDPPPDELWEEEEEGGSRARSRSASHHEGEGSSEGGCDLSWGLDDREDDPAVPRGRGRQDDDEALLGGTEDCEGRAQSVPDLDPNWELNGGGGVSTRRGRARSQSFYSDDEVIMACINGETPPKKTSSLSAAIADASEVYRHSGADRHNSLAYSSSSEMSGSEVEAITQPRDRIGELASQATGVVPASLGGSRRETPSAPTVASSGRRALRPNEMEALLQGLRAPIPGHQHNADNNLSSDSDSDSEEEGYTSGDDDERLPHDYELPGDGVAVQSYLPTDEFVISGEERMAPDHDSEGSRRERLPGIDAGVEAVGERGSSRHALSGSPRMFAPGVDPFVSVPGGTISPPLSPLATVPAIGFGPTLPVAPAIAPAYSLAHLPPPQMSPPRFSSPPPQMMPLSTQAAPPGVLTATMSSPAGSRGVEERDVQPIRAPIVSWPPRGDEALGAGVEPATKASDEDDDDPAAAALMDEGLVGSSILDNYDEMRLSSLSLEDAAPSGVSVPTSPPVQLAPLPPPPPPEPRAPSPPHSRTRAPDAPAEAAPFVPSPLAVLVDDDHHRERAPSPSYDVVDRGGGGITGSGVGGGESGSGIHGRGFNAQGYVSGVNPLMPPPHPPSAVAKSPGVNSGSGGGEGGGPYGSGVGSSSGSGSRQEGISTAMGAGYGPSSNNWGSAVGGGSGYRPSPTGSYSSGGSSGGISRFMGPEGPFGSNRGGGVSYGPQARYHSGRSGGNGPSNLYGSAPGTLGDESSGSLHGLRGSSSVQGFLSVGGGSRPGLRRTRGGVPVAKKIKLLMLGDSGVGKSSLMDRFTEDHFNLTTVGTVGVDFKVRTRIINQEEVLVQVWDTAGQQRFHKITQAFYRGSHGIVLVYDVSDPQTLDNIAYWMKSIRDNAGSNSRVQICLVGNKVDLRDETGDVECRMVQTCSGRMIADQFGAEFFECSAKTGRNVEEAFVGVATKAYEAHLSKPPTPSTKLRRRLGRRKHQRQPSMGSDKDRPPRSDGSWSTASSLSGVDSAERLDNARMKNFASDASEASTTSLASQVSPVTSAPTSTHSSHRIMSFSSSTLPIVNSPLVPAPSPVNSFLSTSPQLHRPVLVLPAPVAEDIAGVGPGGHILGSPSPLSELSPTTAAATAAAPVTIKIKEGIVPVLATVGQGSGKRVVDLGDEDSPTNTGTLSPIPGHQRSIGQTSSLGDVETFFGTASSSSSHAERGTDGISIGNATRDPSRRRADTGSGLLEHIFVGPNSGNSSGGSRDGFSDGDERSSPRDSRRGSGVVAEIVARQRQRSSPRTDDRSGGGSKAAAGGGWREDAPPPPAVSKVKGKKPPRVPRMKRMASGDAVEGSSGGRGKGGMCKVS